MLRPFFKALRYLFVLFVLLILIGEIDQFTHGPTVNLQNEDASLPPRAQDLGPGFRMRVPEVLNRDRHDLVSLGTAFAINDSGDWATAKHVSRDCAALVLLEAGEQRGYPVKMVIDHPRTDLSVLVTGGSFDALTIADRDPGTDETGYFIGYPQGDPASVEANYLGRDDVDVIDDLAPGRPPERLVGDYWVEFPPDPEFLRHPRRHERRAGPRRRGRRDRRDGRRGAAPGPGHLGHAGKPGRAPARRRLRRLAHRERSPPPRHAARGLGLESPAIRQRSQEQDAGRRSLVLRIPQRRPAKAAAALELSVDA